MKTEFISVMKKEIIYHKAISDNIKKSKKGTDQLMNEISRLENIIMIYENVLSMAAASLASNAFKEPKP